MAEYRSKINKSLKQRLVAEAGNKCANPGCPNQRSQIHHIHVWHIYRTHDERHMIALCPSCHDAVHHGSIVIDDETLYRWKGFKRDPSIARHHIYLEPTATPELWFGSFAICVDQRAAVIELSPTNKVVMEVKEEEILILDMTLTTVGGQELVKVQNNIVTHRAVDGVRFDAVPGMVQLVAPLDTPLVPKWLPKRMNAPKANGQIINYPFGGHFTMFKAEVVRPGVARIGGIWALDDRAIVSDRGLHFVSRTHTGPITMVAQTEGTSKFQVSSTVNKKVFGFVGDGAFVEFKKLDPATGPLAIDRDDD